MSVAEEAVVDLVETDQTVVTGVIVKVATGGETWEMRLRKREVRLVASTLTSVAAQAVGVVEHKS